MSVSLKTFRSSRAESRGRDGRLHPSGRECGGGVCWYLETWCIAKGLRVGPEPCCTPGQVSECLLGEGGALDDVIATLLQVRVGEHLHMFTDTFTHTYVNTVEDAALWLNTRMTVKHHMMSKAGVTRVITPMRSSSLLGLRGMRLGVEWPEPGGEPPNEEPAHSDGGMEFMERNRPPRLSPLPTRHSISSARMAVLSFSSWIILWREDRREAAVLTLRSITSLTKEVSYLISLLIASSCSCSIRASV